MVDVVGAGRPNETVSDVGIGAGSKMQFEDGRLLKRGQVEGWMWEVITRSGSEERRCGRRESSSVVRPEKVNRRTASCCSSDQWANMISSR